MTKKERERLEFLLDKWGGEVAREHFLEVLPEKIREAVEHGPSMERRVSTYLNREALEPLNDAINAESAKMIDAPPGWLRRIVAENLEMAVADVLTVCADAQSSYRCSHCQREEVRVTATDGLEASDA